jgi:hypothetical protein
MRDDFSWLPVAVAARGLMLSRGGMQQEREAKSATTRSTVRKLSIVSNPACLRVKHPISVYQLFRQISIYVIYLFVFSIVWCIISAHTNG